jgi:hypothetical protein
MFFLASGAWAFVAPHSFYVTLAHYPPYNEHLFHDIGAFQLGLGAALVAGLTRLGGGLVVGLVGGVVGAGVHAISHWVDWHQGGRSSDPILLTLFAALLLGALIVAFRRRA